MLNTSDRIIKHKVGLLNLAEELGNVSKACQVMGLSRDRKKGALFPYRATHRKRDQIAVSCPDAKVHT